MNRTKKLSGAAKDRFFENFFREEPGLDGETAALLAKKSAATFSSVNVRPKADDPSSSAQAQSERNDLQPPETEPEEDAPFDPYCFGLVPVFQREGRAGLLKRLAGLKDGGQMRQMARAQQIGLGGKAKQGGLDKKQLAAVIADAVARKIADRKAAAG